MGELLTSPMWFVVFAGLIAAAGGALVRGWRNAPEPADEDPEDSYASRRQGWAFTGSLDNPASARNAAHAAISHMSHAERAELIKYLVNYDSADSPDSASSPDPRFVTPVPVPDYSAKPMPVSNPSEPAVPDYVRYLPKDALIEAPPAHSQPTTDYLPPSSKPGGHSA